MLALQLISAGGGYSRACEAGDSGEESRAISTLVPEAFWVAVVFPARGVTVEEDNKAEPEESEKNLLCKHCIALYQLNTPLKGRKNTI